MKRFCVILMIAAVTTGMSVCIGATKEKENPYRWKSKVTSVTVFKNGLGFFMREGKVSLRDGWCVSEAIPPATFGTLAVYSHGKDETVDIIGSGPGELVEFDGVDAPKDVAAKRTRLEACKFLNLQLTYEQGGQDLVAAGKLVSVGPEFVVLEADRNSFAVPLEEISKMQVLENPLRIHVSSDSGKSPDTSLLGMAYLRKGVTWIPEYTLKILDDDTAELTLRGTLVNEAEDMIHCDVNFVVGVPHFVHTEYMAPVAVGQVIRTIGSAVAPRELSTQIMNRAAITSNDMRSDQFAVAEQPVTTGGGDLGQTMGNLPKWEGAGANDYTVYTRKDMTLRRGEKAIVTLFVKRIKYGHVYRWTVPGDLGHNLVLYNNTDSSWTTGPCLAISGNNPLSEDLLKYVPKGGRGELPVTTAINVAHNQIETEVDRKLKAHQPTHNQFLDLVTLDGELTMRNYEKEDIDLIVSIRIDGKALTASDEGAIVQDTKELVLVRRTGYITWQVTLKPGESKKLKYTYERYVSSN